MLRWRRKILAFKAEATPGVDPTPTAAANAILCRNVTLRPLELIYEDRSAIDTGYSGHKGEIIAGQYGALDFEVELAGAGAAGTVPKYGPILKACACSETVNPGVSVVYAPVNPGAEVSGTTYLWIDGVLHEFNFMIGNAGVMFTRNRVPFLRFSFMGLFVGPVDQAVPVNADFSGFIKPVAVNLANTTPMTLHAFAGKFGDASIDFGNQVVYRNLPNSEAIRLVDRKSVGAVRLEAELVAAKDWWTILRNGTLGAFTVTHGQTGGNQVVVAAPNAQLTRPSKSVEDELAMLSMNLVLQPSAAGNDEWSITVK